MMPLLIMAGWLLAAMLAGCNRSADNPAVSSDVARRNQVQTEYAALPVREGVPPLDAQRPANLAQATFALG